MSTRMLIDARHSEETRVTVVKGNRVEEFDYESATRRQLKGNIYLARVTRVEPSLQAAFVEYGGNRHGFLAFSEIHPDYYQIPVEDKEEMIKAEMAAAKSRKSREDSEDAEKDSRQRPRRRRGRKSAAERAAEKDAKITEDAPEDVIVDAEGAQVASEASTDDDSAQTSSSDDNAEANSADAKTDAEQEETPDTAINEENTDDDASNDVSADDEENSDVKDSDEEDRDSEVEEAADRRRAIRALKRRYSIQEVIKRRQVLLIQVVKEERGNKGAALTTYMSLAGRYCVLMPNSTHSGGISRKISNIGDRKKLKNIISSLEVPDEMGLIVRTAGLSRTKTEIKRDYDYLLRLWTGIRDLTLKSTAPALVYEEGNLIKRTIRDLYAREVDEILVEGERGYRAAKDFMKLLMPSHAKKVQHYKDSIPLYHRYQVESSLEAMYQPVVQLKSGGYIVINPTEALISIDVNSGRATKEHNIEETAVKTNLEAAEEVARQLRLRDMAGLVVIDFIDMEDRGNNRAVERKMKDMLKNDRARIQVGRISSFGLMEMSRQRLRPNLLEVAMETCATCAGTGIVRSVESASLMALRQLEEEGIRNRSHTVRISTNPDVAVYLLNKKRAVLSALEAQYDLIIEVLAQPTLGQSDIEITRETTVHAKAPLTADAVVTLESSAPDFNDTDDTDEKSEKSEKSEKEETNTPVAKADDDDEHPRKKRRRRRRRRRGGEDAENGDHRSNRQQNASSEEDTEETAGETRAENADDDTEDKPRSRRRRGTRGGRRRRSHNDAPTENRENGETVSAETVSTDHADEAPKAVGAQEGDAASQEGEAASDDKKPTRRRRRIRRTSSDETPASAEASAPAEVHETATENAVEEKPKRRGRRKAADTETETSQAEKAGDTPKPDEKPKPRRRRAAKAVEKTAGVDSTVSVEAKDETAEKPKRRRRTTKAAVETTDAPKVSESGSPSAAEKPAKAKRAPRKSDAKPAEAKPAVKAAAKTAAEPVSAPKPKATLVESTGGEGKAGRKGWWQRTFG